MSNFTTPEADDPIILDNPQNKISYYYFIAHRDQGER